MIRWTSAALGGAAFLAAHLVQTLAWRSWFHGTFEPWFLNSGRAAAFTAALLVAAGAAVSASDWRESVIRGAHVAAGALVAMIVVLSVIGPGNLFPIVIVLGAAIALASGGAGALAGWSLRRVRTR
jgi:hypothetical protein